MNEDKKTAAAEHEKEIKRASASHAQYQGGDGVFDIRENNHNGAKGKRKKSGKKPVILMLLSGILMLSGIGLAVIGSGTRETDKGPQVVEFSTRVPEATAVPAAEAEPAQTPEPTAVPTAAAKTAEPGTVEALEQQADSSLMNDIVNIMLIGVDYAEERETWSGKDGLTACHADVMMVLAINFSENKADLISLPRDTYTHIPGVSGIYKLNAALNCGGGLYAEGGAGFLKVCEAASELLGGQPVNYYYAVTMPAVKQLVDAIGGLDYDLEITFKIQGRSYKEGYQHMNGQAVLDYLRVRKSGTGLGKGETGDANRVNRQKKMMVAIFEKIKQEEMLAKIPDILSSFQGQLFTNCSFAQTAALALYGYSVPKENIGMYSMSGSSKNIYTWNFTFTDMKNRRNIIKSIYGTDVGDIRNCTQEYAVYEYYDRTAAQYLSTCEPMLDALSAQASQGFFDELEPSYEQNPIITYDDTPKGGEQKWEPEGDFDIIIVPQEQNSPSVPEPAQQDDSSVIIIVGNKEGASAGGRGVRVLTSRSQTGRILPRKASGSGYSAYHSFESAYHELKSTLSEARARASKYLNGSVSDMGGYEKKLESACGDLKACAETAASVLGYGGSLHWDMKALAKTNEIYVDFR